MKRRQLVKLLLTLATGSAIAGIPLTTIAKPGRPASPNSVAGANRRRQRRTRRRVHRNMRVYSLPYGCSVTRTRRGRTYYYCGGIWYRPMYQGTTVVYIVDDIESGADTEVIFLEYE